MMSVRCFAFDSTRRRLSFCGKRDRPHHTFQQHAGVAVNGIQRRAELVRHVGEELRLQRGRLLELDVLPAEELVLPDQLGGRGVDLRFQLVGGALQLLVQPLLLQGRRPVVQDRHDTDQLAVFREHLGRRGVEWQGRSGLRIDESDEAAVSRIITAEQVGHERGKVGIVGWDAARHVAFASRRGGEEPLGRRIHLDDRSAGIGDENRIHNGIDQQAHPVAVRPDLGGGAAQLPVVLLDLLGGPPQVRHVAQDRHDSGAVLRIVDRPTHELEEKV